MLSKIHQVAVPQPNLYSALMLLAIIVSAIYWARVSRADSRLPIIYLLALGGAFLGAKLAYLASEGWMHTGDDKWLHWLTGKSITGALLFGFLSVEICKKLIGYRAITGDRFALIVPIGILLGRLGCLSQGCCRGCVIDAAGTRWPAVPVELGFNVIAVLVLLVLRKLKSQTYQHFHLYLMAYGGFRFAHEFLRDTPKPFAGMSGYQIISIIIFMVGVVAYRRRMKTL